MGNHNALELTKFEQTLWFYLNTQKEDLVMAPTEELWGYFFSFYGLDESLTNTIVNHDKTIKIAIDIEKDQLYNSNTHPIIFGNFLSSLKGNDYKEIYLPLLEEFKLIRKKEIRDLNLLNALFYHVLVRKSLEKINPNNTKSDFERNQQVYRELYNWLNLCHSYVASWNIFDNGQLNEFNKPLSESLSNIKAIFSIFEIIKREGFDKYSDIILIYYEALNYVIQGYIDTIWLILSLQLVNASPFYTIQDRKFSSDLIEIFKGILKEARILKILKNEHFFNENLEQEARTSADRTTRFQILFEYSNGDQYSLRLDLAHMGVDSFHLNMTSKGKIDSFPLTKEQFVNFVEDNDTYKDWFISYNDNYYYLREEKRKIFRENLPEYEGLIEQLKINEHYTIDSFGKEKAVLSVLESWKRVFNSNNYLMLNEKINPYPFYAESVIVEYIHRYILEKISHSQCTEKTREEILRYMEGLGLFSSEALLDYKTSSTPELLYLALEYTRDR